MTASSAHSVDTPVEPDRTQRRDVPALVFRIVAAVVVGFLLTGPGGIPDLLESLGLVYAHDHAFAVLHRWHVVDIVGYISIMTVGMLVVAAWRPRRSAGLLQVILASLAGLGLIALARPSPGEVLVPVALVGLLLVGAFPQRRTLLRLHISGVRSRTAVVAAAIVTPFLVSNLWENLSRQIGGTDPHALLGHWAGAAALAFGLLVSSWFAVTRAPGARAVAGVVAATLLYLGGFALVLTRYDGVWAPWGAMCAIVAGGCFLASIWKEG